VNVEGGLVNCMEKMFSDDYDKDYYKGPREFQLVGWHFHHGTEHTIKDHRYDIEMHMVHKSRLP
jgi:carbonic anhydrase